MTKVMSLAWYQKIYYINLIILKTTRLNIVLELYSFSNVGRYLCSQRNILLSLIRFIENNIYIYIVKLKIDGLNKKQLLYFSMRG